MGAALGCERNEAGGKEKTWSCRFPRVIVPVKIFIHGANICSIGWPDW